MKKPGDTIETCPDCVQTYLACPACGHCDNNLAHENESCTCGRGKLLKKTVKHCCQSTWHHIGATCSHCGQRG